MKNVKNIRIILQFLVFCFLVNNSIVINAQKLPSQLSISQDGRMLLSGANTMGGFYAPNEIKNLHLYFSQPNYWTLLTNNYKSETLLPATLKYEGITLENVGVRFRGNTSYQQTGTSKKKSFAIETDFMIENQTLMGYKNIKLNNSHQDPSFMREVLYSRLGVRYTPMAHTNYIHLFINDEDWGIYPNVQSLDKTFLEEWFMSNDGARFRATTDNPQQGGGGTMPPPGGQWGDGTAGMNYLGDDTTLYQKYYTLKSSDIDESWQKLVTVTKKLNEVTSDNYQFIEDYLDIDKTLWFLAVENVFTDDDSYIMKGKMDYMIYYEPETGLTSPLEYDGNSTMALNTAANSSWAPFKNTANTKYPLLNKLLNVPEYRSRYLAHYRTILNETFTTEKIHKLFDETNALIQDFVFADTKKLNSNNEYTSSVNGLKTYITNRRNFILNIAEIKQIAPKINTANHFTIDGHELQNPNPNEKVIIKANISKDVNVNNVFLYYSAGVVGKFTKVEMFDDGLHNDNAADDGFYGAEIPGFPAGTLVRYYVQASTINQNNIEVYSYHPQGAEHDVFIYKVNINSNPNGVVINEFMAQNASSVADEAGDFDDWIELYNNNSSEVNLSGYYISDKIDNVIKWQIPQGTIIPANGYLIIWADEEQEEGALHCNFRLSVLGETITLTNPNNEIIDQVIFTEQETDKSSARKPNGVGEFVIGNPTFNKTNDDLNSLDNEMILPSLFNVYPSIVENFTTIEVSENLIGNKIFVWNELGELINTFSITNNKMKINFQNENSGMYLIQVGNQIQKVIKY